MANRIDSRELVEELDELEAQDDDENPLDDEDIERRDAIRELFEEIEGYAGDSARDGIFLIPEDDFVNYAREFAEDIGAIPDEVSWPFTCIDWTEAAHELSVDYTSVTFDGTEYLYR